MKKILAITIMALVLGAGTPAAFAGDGTAESPGFTSEQSNDTTLYAAADGTAESPGYLGTAESPGFMVTVLIYLDAVV